jgi:putative transposase
MKYAWIKAQHHQRAFNVNAMCEMLGVLRRGYYAWKNHPQPAREKEDIRLGELIKKSFDEGRHTYGRKRIQDDLKDGAKKSARVVLVCDGKIGFMVQNAQKI